MRTIAVVNQKGGCGKTTVSVNLASAVAELGHKTLLIDMDPQSHCAVGLAVPEEQIEQSIYDVLISHSRNEPIRLTEVLWQISDRLDLAPASIDLTAFDQQMIGVSDRENCLKNILAELKDEYDYVIIDCPPAVGLLTFNAIRTATDVIVPVETGYFSLHGLSKQLETLSVLCERCNQQINVRVLASMYDIRTKMAREILAELRAHFADKMFKTIVNFNTKIKEAASFGQPINEYDPASKGQVDFCELAEEVIAMQQNQQRRDLVNSLAGQLEEISTTADELLKAAKPAIRSMSIPKTQRKQPAEFNAEISRCINTPKERLLEDYQTRQRDNSGTLQTAPAIKTVKSFGTEQQKPTSLDTKLSDYYGVNQINDAVAFVTLYPRADSVQVAGDFNNWQPEKAQMKKVGSSGVWQTKIKLPAGKFRYRLVVDGQWQQDPYNENTEANPFGGFNSVLEVK